MGTAKDRSLWLLKDTDSTHIHTNKLKEKKYDAPPHKCPGGSLMHTLANNQTFIFASVAVPAEDHRGARPADGGRSGVHLQL